MSGGGVGGGTLLPSEEQIPQGWRPMGLETPWDRPVQSP
jgi:hypothetical protein